MAGFVSPPPSWTDVSSEEYQLWFTQVARIINNNATGAVGGGAGDISGLVLNTASGEIIQGAELYGYFRRYLHIRFASDINGSTQVTDPTSFTGTTLYIGTFNTDLTNLPADANFVYRPFTFPTGGQVSYRLEGGRRIEFSTLATAPTGNTLLNTPGFIDLDDIIGEAGDTPVAFYSQNSLNDRPTQNPAENAAIWDRQDVAAANPSRTYNWIIWGFERGAAARAQYTLSTSGTTGTQTGNPGQAEVGTIEVDSTALVQTGTTGTRESFELTVTGNTGTSGSTQVMVPAYTVGTTLTEGFQFAIRLSLTQDGNINIPANPTSLSNFILAIDDFAQVVNFSASLTDVPDNTVAITTRAQLITQLTSALPGITLTAGSVTTTTLTVDHVEGTPVGDAIDIVLTANNIGTRVSTISSLPPLSQLQYGSNAVTSVEFISITYGDITTPSQIRIQVPANSIDETLTLSPSLTTQMTIADDIVTMFNANTNLRAFFNAASRNASNQVIFEATNVGDIVAMFSAIDQSGDITLAVTSMDGSGAGSFVSPVVQINFDSTRDNPTVTMVTLASGDGATDIASDIATAINNHAQYTASVNSGNNRLVNYSKNAVGVSDDLTITVLTVGNSNLATGLFTVTITTQGRNAGLIGQLGSYTIMAGTESYSGAFPAGTTAAQVIDTVRTQINSGSTFTGVETSPTAVTFTADDEGPAVLTININAGSGDLIALFAQTQTGALGGFNPISSINQFRGNSGPQGSFRIDAFIRSATTPAEPTGGNQTTPPTGWSYTIPTGTNQIYQSFVIFDPINDTATTDFGTRWSPPFQAGSQGPSGSDGVGSQTRIIFHNNARNSTPTLPSGTNVIDNGWTATPGTNSNWFAEQVNITNAAGDSVTTYGSWGGPILITGADGVNPTVVDNGDGTYTVTDGDGNSVTIEDGAMGMTGPMGPDGNDGANGNTVDIVFQRSTTVPTTPSPSAGVPTGWFGTTNDVPSTPSGGLIYASFGIQIAGAGNFTWEAPVQVQGADGADGLAGVSGSFTQVRFADDATQPATTTYPTNDLGTNTTWTASSTDAIWVITRQVTFSSTNVRTNGSWSISRFRGENGTAGQDGSDGLDGSNGAPGANGAGLYNVSLGLTQTQLDALTTSAINTQFVTVSGRDPVQGDIFVLNGTGDAIRTVRYSGTIWEVQTAFIDGDLVVNGTITTDQIAANTITADNIAGNTITGTQIAANTIDAGRLSVTELSAISANLGTITAGTIDASTATINNLNASNITTGTLNADRIQLDDATLDTDASGNIVVQTVAGGGILATPSGLEVNPDGTTIVLRNNQLEAVATTTTINTVTWTGGQTARTFNRTPTATTTFGTTERYNDAVFFWRYDMNVIGMAQYQALTGITLENFDATISVSATERPNNNLTNIFLDLEYYTASGTTTGFNTVSTFDGRVRVRDLAPPPGFGSTTDTANASGTFSTVGTQFTPPVGNGRFLFLGFRFRATGGGAYNTGEVTYSLTFPSQSDTRMILHFENGSSRTETFNSFFV